MEYPKLDYKKGGFTISGPCKAAAMRGASGALKPEVLEVWARVRSDAHNQGYT
jgi:hypothetical protein